MPNTTIMMHHPSGAARGQATDIHNEARELMRVRNYVNGVLSNVTERPVEQVCCRCSTPCCCSCGGTVQAWGPAAPFCCRVGSVGSVACCRVGVQRGSLAATCACLRREAPTELADRLRPGFCLCMRWAALLIFCLSGAWSPDPPTSVVSLILTLNATA